MNHTPFAFASKVKDSKIVFIGENLTKEDLMQKGLFSGESGKEFNRILASAKLLDSQNTDESYYSWQSRITKERENEYFTSPVFPTTEKIENLCQKKTIVLGEYIEILPTLKKEYPDFPWPKEYSWNDLGKSGQYLRPKHLRILPRLQKELQNITNCNVIVAMGPLALWVLTGSAKIQSMRGNICAGTLTKHKIFPTFSLSFVLKMWEERVTLIADLINAKKQSKFPDIKIPERFIWVCPKIQDLYDFDEKYLKKSSLVSVDIETKREQIDCIGFASDSSHAIVVPFYDELKRNYNYWQKSSDELLAWEWVKKICERNQPKVLQNFLYDVQFTWQKHGIRIRNIVQDTMIMHHALYPEKKKGLGFLGSLYTDEPNWKDLNKHNNKED